MQIKMLSTTVVISTSRINESFRQLHLTFKAPITTAADDTFNFSFFFLKKTSLGILCESSAKQTIHN